MRINRCVRFDFGGSTVLSVLTWSSSVVLHDTQIYNVVIINPIAYAK